MKFQRTLCLSLFWSLGFMGSAGAVDPSPQAQQKEAKAAEDAFSTWYAKEFSDNLAADKKGRKVQHLVLRHSKSLDMMIINKKYATLPEECFGLTGNEYKLLTPEQMTKLKGEAQELEVKMQRAAAERASTPPTASPSKVPPPAAANQKQGLRRAEVAFGKWYRAEFDNKLDKDKKGNAIDAILLRQSPGCKEITLKKVYVGNTKPNHYVLSADGEFKPATPEQLTILIDEEKKLTPLPSGAAVPAQPAAPNPKPVPK
jgi:hypothetical protein